MRRRVNFRSRKRPYLTGSYIIYARISHEVIVQIGNPKSPQGRKRYSSLPAGHYAYVGSAFQSGGLAARLGRHLGLKEAKRKRWDIDYLLARSVEGRALQAWVSTSDERLECTWATALFAATGVSAPAPGFGAGDCKMRCGCRDDRPKKDKTHLFRLPLRPTLAWLRDALGPAALTLRCWAPRR